MLVFAALAVWQVERLFWKLDLIARVDARVHAVPIAFPARSGWSIINARDDEYRHVTATGTFLHERTTMVDALTERGSGYWVLTPLATANGIVLVNRGFVPMDRRTDAARPMGPVVITGLLRISEPAGRFLRSNDPAHDRWFSRDLAAIAKMRGLGNVAPFFIDAGPTTEGVWPVGGLTVVTFRNAHFPYALTWIVLAALSGFGAWRVAREPH